MTTRMRNRKRPEPGQKSTPMALGPTIGLMAVCLLGIVCMFLWTTRHASAPMAAQPARSAPAYTPKHIYSETANPSGDIAAALARRSASTSA